MKSLILLVEYDGSDFCGFQSQKNSISVQDSIESAYSTIFGEASRLVAAGRTDAGVHAKGQVVSFHIEKEINIPIDKIPKAFNGNLPKSIRISQASVINGDFSARFDARFREYNYFLSLKDSPFEGRFSSYLRFPISKKLLFDSAEIFLGKKDFTTFSKFNESNRHPICEVVVSRWSEINDNLLKFEIKSNRFIYGMVRAIVGAMTDIARGKRTIEETKIALEKRDRAYASPLADPRGLILNRIYYPEKFNLFNNSSESSYEKD